MAVIPYLYYSDVASALKFLSKAFGFRRFGVTMKGKRGDIQHAAMKFGEDVIMMGDPGAKYKNPKVLGQATQCVFVNVDDVDKHCATARRAGAKIIQEPEDTPFGQRRYGAEDPEGHQWYFGQEPKKSKALKRK